jgi:hypothetical protein
MATIMVSIRKYHTRMKKFIFPAILLLTLYYVVSFSALLNISHALPAIQYVEVINSTNAIKYVTDTNNPTLPILNIITILHRNNPDVLAALCQSDNTIFDNTHRVTTCRQAYERDPYNVSTFRAYLRVLFHTASRQEICSSMEQISPLSVLFQREEVKQQLTSSFFDSLPTQSLTVSEYMSQLYYLLGLGTITSDPEITKQFWTAARDLSPDWSYFHIELASLEYHQLREKQEAYNVLQNCERNKFAAYHCSHIDLISLLPGDLLESIENISSYE